MAYLLNGDTVASLADRTALQQADAKKAEQARLEQLKAQQKADEDAANAQLGSATSGFYGTGGGNQGSIPVPPLGSAISARLGRLRVCEGGCFAN